MERILAPQLFDVIRERFGQMADVLTYTSFFYGGAVRDVLAGIPLQGDLDIAVSRGPGEITAIRNNIKKYAADWEARPEKPAFGNYGEDHPSLIDGMEEYQFKGRLTQIMVSSCLKGDAIEKALNIVKQVDIVCCGVALDCWGYVYEMVPGAITHCRERVLVYNTEQQYHQNGQKSQRYLSRIHKLRERGWKLLG